MGLTAGDMLQDRYRIASRLGLGGMGAVYRGWDTHLNVPVAIKEMIPQPGIDPQMLTQLRRQFQQEATILTYLDHPHLVRTTDFFEESGNAYLVMDFVAGENLAGLIFHRGPLPEAEVLPWAEQLLDALGYCHSRGVFHRDVKPQNVIIRPDDRAILADFGLVKLWVPDDPHTRTAMQRTGTPEYAPPEQHRATASHTDARSDIYGLGATLYHALAGQAPPTATARITGPVALEPLRVLVPGVSEQTETAIARALELQPAARFQSAREMRAALSGKRPAPSRRRWAKERPGTQQSGPVSRWTWTLVSLVIVSLVIALLIAFVGSRILSYHPPQIERTPTPIDAVQTRALLPSPSPQRLPTPTLTPIYRTRTDADSTDSLYRRESASES